MAWVCNENFRGRTKWTTNLVWYRCYYTPLPERKMRKIERKHRQAKDDARVNHDSLRKDIDDLRRVVDEGEKQRTGLYRALGRQMANNASILSGEVVKSLIDLVAVRFVPHGRPAPTTLRDTIEYLPPRSKAALQWDEGLDAIFNDFHRRCVAQAHPFCVEGTYTSAAACIEEYNDAISDKLRRECFANAVNALDALGFFRMSSIC
jgi:hypothetical protein